MQLQGHGLQSTRYTLTFTCHPRVGYCSKAFHEHSHLMPLQDHAAKPLAPLQYPGYFNQWVYNKKNLSLKWDGGEKFYNHVAWLFYMISIFFEPWGVTLSGVVEWTGGYSLDCGILTVFQNKVTTILFPSSYRLPLTSDPTDVPWPFTLESNMFASNICEQLLSMLLAAVLGDIDKVHDLAQGTLFQLLDWDNIEFVGFSAARVGLRTLVASVLQASAGDAELLPSMVEIVQLGIPPSLCELLDSARSGRQPIHFTAPWGISDQISTCHTHTSELGYMTATHGSFELSRALTEDETRQLNRILQAAYIDGEAPGYALAAAAPALVIMNQRHNIAAPPTPQQLLRHAAPPLAQHHYPGKSCPWRLRAGRLEFDDGSNGYQFVAWLSYLLANFFIPLGVQLSGVMEWNSEEAWDSGVLVVNDNEVTVAIFPSTNRFEFEYLRDTIDYVTEKHHIKKAIKVGGSNILTMQYLNCWTFYYTACCLQRVFSRKNLTKRILFWNQLDTPHSNRQLSVLGQLYQEISPRSNPDCVCTCFRKRRRCVLV